MDMPETIWAKCDDVHGAIQVGGWSDTVRQCPDGTQYRRADLPPRVKPLEWVQSNRIEWMWRVEDWPYDIRCEGGIGYLVDYDSETLAGKPGGPHDTLDAAKAAAQADYTARILAALEGEE